jgi:fatty acid CoA ligase FadD9
LRSLTTGPFHTSQALYTTHPEVEQAFIYGNSLRSYVLAVVVPSPELLAETPDASALKDRLRRVLESTAKQAGLASYEVPRDFVVEREPFSRANSLLTDSCKPARRNLRQRYAPVLEDMYEAIEEQRRQRLATVSTGPSATTEDKVGWGGGGGCCFCAHVWVPCLRACIYLEALCL